MFRPSRLVPLKMAQIACYPPPDGTTAEVLAATAAAEAAMTWWIAFCTASTAQPPCEISSARASRPIPRSRSATHRNRRQAGPLNPAGI